jgi:hypothetical protein
MDIKFLQAMKEKQKKMELKTKFLKCWNSLFVDRVKRGTITMAWVCKRKTS